MAWTQNSHTHCMQASADSDSRNLATLLLLRDLQSKRMGSEAALRKAESVGDGRIRPRMIQSSSWTLHSALQQR